MYTYILQLKAPKQIKDVEVESGDPYATPPLSVYLDTLKLQTNPWLLWFFFASADLCPCLAEFGAWVSTYGARFSNQRARYN